MFFMAEDLGLSSLWKDVVGGRSPGPEWDLETLRFYSRNGSSTKHLHAFLTCRKNWASFWQPTAHSWGWFLEPSSSPVPVCWMFLPLPLRPLLHSDWLFFSPLLSLPRPASLFGPIGMDLNWHYLVVISLSLSLTELSIFVYDYGLLKIHWLHLYVICVVFS